MNAPSLKSFSPTNKSNNAVGSQPAIIDLVAKEVIDRHPWLRALGLGVFGLMGILFLFILVRLLLVSHLQGEMLDPLGRVVRRLDLSAGASKLVWYSTFGWSAASLGLVMRRFAHLLLPLPLFRLSFQDNLLLTLLFSVPLLAPDIAKKLCPVREIDPAAVAWFDESEDGSLTPHGLIGYVREENGNWWFCNVRGGPRPSDGTLIQPVTPSTRRDWQNSLRQQQEMEAKIQRAAQEKAEDSRRRAEAATESEHRRQKEAAEAMAALKKAETARQASEAAAENARRERIAAEQQLQKQKKETADAEAKATAERLRAAQTRVLNTSYGNGIAVPRSGQEESGTKSPFHFAQHNPADAEPQRPARTVIMDEPLRLVQAREVPQPWNRCNHCGQLPTSHVWVSGRMRCPSPENCHNCGRPLRFHRQVQELVDGDVHDRIACPK